MAQEFKHLALLKTEKVNEGSFPKEIKSKISGFKLQLAKFQKGDAQAENTAAKISDDIADMLTEWHKTEEYADLLDGGKGKKAAEEKRIQDLADKKAAEKLAADKAAADKLAAEKAEADRIAAEKEGAEKAEAERIAAEKADAEKAEADRIAKEEADRIAAEKAARRKAKDDNAALNILTGNYTDDED